MLGEPRSTVAAEHFAAAPTATATVAVGTLVWWYHQAVLKEPGTATRTEVTRLYEYLMAGLGLLAATGGLITLVAALIDALAGNAFVGGSIVNTLLAGTTLLAVGGPVWWLHWREIQVATRAAGAEEVTSPTRRVYLYVLFGVGAVAAVVALVVAAYLLFQDIVSGTAGADTLRRMRFAIGALLGTGDRRIPLDGPSGRSPSPVIDEHDTRTEVDPRGPRRSGDRAGSRPPHPWPGSDLDPHRQRRADLDRRRRHGSDRRHHGRGDHRALRIGSAPCHPRPSRACSLVAGQGPVTRKKTGTGQPVTVRTR